MVAVEELGRIAMAALDAQSNFSPSSTLRGCFEGWEER